MSTSELALTAFPIYHRVVLPILVRMQTAWAVLDLAGRVAAVRGGPRRSAHWQGATSGIAIWSMHGARMAAAAFTRPGPAPDFSHAAGWTEGVL